MYVTCGTLSHQIKKNRISMKFFSTLKSTNHPTGDLAEMVMVQGPQLKSEHFALGADGSWNSTSRPLHYFLGANENLQMTAAEIRGGLDGLILADQVNEHYKRYGSLKLSQVLDMYYNRRGLIHQDVRACDRRRNLLNVAPTDMLVAQVSLLNPW